MNPTKIRFFGRLITQLAFTALTDELIHRIVDPVYPPTLNHWKSKTTNGATLSQGDHFSTRKSCYYGAVLDNESLPIVIEMPENQRQTGPLLPNTAIRQLFCRLAQTKGITLDQQNLVYHLTRTKGTKNDVSYWANHLPTTG